MAKDYEGDLEDEGPKEVLTFSKDKPEQSTLLAEWLSLFLLKLQAAYQIASNPMNALFQFLSAFLHCLSLVHVQFKGLAKAFPKSSYMARKLLEEGLLLQSILCARNVSSCTTLLNVLSNPAKGVVLKFVPLDDFPVIISKG